MHQTVKAVTFMMHLHKLSSLRQFAVVRLTWWNRLQSYLFGLANRGLGVAWFLGLWSRPDIQCLWTPLLDPLRSELAKGIWIAIVDLSLRLFVRLFIDNYLALNILPSLSRSRIRALLLSMQRILCGHIWSIHSPVRRSRKIVLPGWLREWCFLSITLGCSTEKAL